MQNQNPLADKSGQPGGKLLSVLFKSIVNVVDYIINDVVYIFNDVNYINNDVNYRFEQERRKFSAWLSGLSAKDA